MGQLGPKLITWQYPGAICPIFRDAFYGIMKHLNEIAALTVDVKIYVQHNISTTRHVGLIINKYRTFGPKISCATIDNCNKIT